ncbi:MAG TPA: hypothetical protein VK796_13365, partial [Cytophaga sp.]|nr:hypothetical protein [Cytophaga sp.]
MDIEFNKNEDALKTLCYALKKRLQKVALGGGEKRLKAEQEKGKLTVRDRIAMLFDKNTTAIEIGALAAED